jgi:hypothetical protein
MVDRKKQLSQVFNNVFKEVVKEDKDFYSHLGISDFVKLKKIVACVNNIITMQVTELFVEYLYRIKVIDFNQKEEIFATINETNANSNGYDVCYENSFQKGVGILAEIKCNIPVNKASFGAAQLVGIINDIRGLLNGKKKCPKDIQKGKFKFMVFLDDQDRVETAINQLLDKEELSLVKLGDDVKRCELTTEKVYVVLLKV